MSKVEFKNLLDNLINEIELAFEYIPSELVNMLKSLDISEQLLDNFFKSLNKFDKQLVDLCLEDKKLNKETINEFDEVVLLDILPFKLFKQENKNTKRSLIKHISNIYVVSNKSLLDKCKIKQDKQLDEQIELDQLKQQSQVQQPELDQLKQQLSQVQHPELVNQLLNGGLGDILKSDALTNIVNNLTNKIRDENIDPTSLLMGMMTGQRNSQQENLMNYLTESINTSLSNDQQFSNSISNLTNNIQNNPELLGKLNAGNINDMLSNMLPK
jgi:hypothetical protein